MLIVYILILSMLSVNCQKQWDHHAVLDDEVDLKWNIEGSDIIMELTVEATGYVAIGLSPNGGMKGADIALGWIDDQGTPHLYDMYAVGNKRPIADEDNSEDYKLISGSQNDTHTVIRLSRVMKSCNQYDFNINEDTIRVIWAYSSKKPTSPETIQYHDRRGTRSLLLRSTPGYLPKDYDLQQFSSFDLRFTEVAVPKQRTLYKCGIMKAPVLQKKHHLVGYSPAITAGNEGIVHHLVVYECSHPRGDNEVFEKHVNQEGSACQTGDMPDEFKFCRKVLIAWAIGSEGDMYNEKAGVPLEGEQYYLLEAHYDNPQLLEGVIDSSGIRVYYTDKLREFDAACGAIGATFIPLQMIPPKTSRYTAVGICPKECTQFFPPGGLHIFQIFFHAHLAGRAIRLRHFRNGTELRAIGVDEHYDFNYQQSRALSPPVNVLPGDILVTECEYDTQERTQLTYGGVGSDEEMCITFTMSYSSETLKSASCFSSVSLASFEEAFGIEFESYKDLYKAYMAHESAKTYYEKHKAFLSALPLLSPANTTFWTYLNNVVWTDSLVSRLENVLLRGGYMVQCGEKRAKKIIYNPADATYNTEKASCSQNVNKGGKKNAKETKKQTKLNKTSSKWTTGENAEIIAKIVEYLLKIA